MQSIICFLSIISLITSYDIDITKISKELTYSNPMFDGIGGLSGGGATSKLLVSYDTKIKSEIYDYLFKPQFGASLHLLKVEIGGDAQSTEGTEASHSHEPNDLNCFRGYEWEILREARIRNPKIKLYSLPWAFPGWVSTVNSNPYENVTKLATYVVNWFKCARDSHHIIMDYVGIWNEKAYNVEYIKMLRKTLNNNGFQSVKIIAADNKWEIASDLEKDKELNEIVYAIGAHYPGTLSSELAKKTRKPLWSSEDYSTSNIETGAACWARILNQNFINGNMTCTISWNLIAAYFDDMPYPRCGLMTSVEPWSGHYLVPDTIWVTAHTTQFTQPGWFYPPFKHPDTHLPHGGSYIVLVDGIHMNNISIIIETMDHNKSVCIRPALPAYTVKDQYVSIAIPSNLMDSKLYWWQTDLLSKNDSDKFQFKGFIKANKSGAVTIFVRTNMLITISTVSTAHKGFYPRKKASKPFPNVYTDNFEKYALSSEPDLLTPQIGSFEVVKSGPGKALLQTVIREPIGWCFSNPLNRQPVALTGNFNRSDIRFSVSVQVPQNSSSTDAVFIGSRINNSGCTTFMAGGVFYWLNVTSSEIFITSQFALPSSPVFRGHVTPKLKKGVWYVMEMMLKGEYGWFYINGQLVADLSNLIDIAPPHGFLGIGTGKYGYALYDNFTIMNF